MLARRGIAFIYDHMTYGLPAEAVDEIDAFLGDEAAARRVNAARMEAVVGMGGEIG
jgi:hypothetical protein